MVSGLQHPIAEQGFRYDMDALEWCDTCVMLMPCGRSASLELGWAVGAGKKTAVLIVEDQEPELTLKMAGLVTSDQEQLIDYLREQPA
jgi:hypothetical protein